MERSEAFGKFNMKVFKGYLTYSLAGIAIIFAILSLVSGFFGFAEFVDQPTAVGILWAGFAVFGVRRAIKNGN